MPFPVICEGSEAIILVDKMNGSADYKIAVFTEALPLQDHERAACLDRACGGDVELRRAVEALLQGYDQVGDFMEESPRAPWTEAIAEAAGVEKPGDFIGGYKLLQQIGEGGCGVVFMAEQTAPIHRKVALKIIKPGMDTKSVIARFEVERQALALMDHPSIAKIFDAGATQSGRPYFVMELVRGIKITEYCDQHSLTTEDRLKLFIQVCKAIQHAHQKGIIHRDIKPSNILVTTTSTSEPLPVVIDFGIAKATTSQRLTDKTLFTAFEMLLGTPAYMSPEQAAFTSVDVDTRTDVYSLGVLLYELLTGSTPFDTEALFKSGLDEIRRVIRDKNPARPSTRLFRMDKESLTVVARNRGSDPPRLTRAIRGDLDWIAIKALEKDRTRRYETANGLAMDIERHLNNDPVAARPPSKLYLLQKLARRNKVAFAAAGVIAVVLILGAVASIWQAVRATRATKAEARQRLEAESAQKDAEAVTRYLMAIFQSPDPSRDGRTITVVESLDRASLRLDTDLAGQPAQRNTLEGAVGRTYHALGLDRKAVPFLEKTRDYYLSNFGLEDVNTIDAMTDLATSYFSMGRREEALKLREQVLELRRRILGTEHPDTLTALNDLAISYQDAGRQEEALKLREQVLELRRRFLGPNHTDTLIAMNNLANSYQDLGRPEEALKLREQAFDLDRNVFGPEHPSTLTAMLNLANIYSSMGRREEALKLREQVLELRRKILGTEHPDTLTALNDLASSYEDMGRSQEALKLREHVLELRRRILGPDHIDTLVAMNNLGDSYEDVGRQEEALKLREQVLEFMRKVSGPEHPNTLVAMNNLAISYQDVGRREEALKLREQVLELRRKVLGPQHPDTLNAMYDLANSCARYGRWKEAASNLYQVIEFRPEEHVAYHMLAPLLVATGDLDGYRKHCERVLAQFGQTKDPSVAERMAKDCLILPGSVSNLSAVGQLADTAVTLGKTPLVPFYQFVKALAEFRQNNFVGAVDWAGKTLASPSGDFRDVQACMVFAMAQCQLKHYEEARVALAKGVEIERAKGPREDGVDFGDEWGDWIIARALTKEAKALVEGSPDKAGVLSERFR